MNKAVNIIDQFDIESPAATEFRRLLHNINGSYAGLVKRSQRDTSESLSEITARLKRVMITSSLGSEGKSTVASFLAIASAKFKERRTLLVDADLRRPSIHRLFSVERGQGLVEALSEGLDPLQLPKKTELPLLDVVTAGKPADQPSEVFDAERLGKILDSFSANYDFVVVDSAPLMPVSDPMLLAAVMDGVLLVIKAGDTPKDVVNRSQALLAGSGTKTLGVVLNNMKHSLPYYYDPGYYEYETEN